MTKTAVVALGGNALIREGERGTQDEQFRNAQVMARSVRSLARDGWRVIIVHGNGPQVGNLAIQHEEGASLVPAQPLFTLGAMTQGALGSLICLAMHNVCGDEIAGVVSVITHVAVDPDDPAFANPTKPIGPFFSEQEMQHLVESRGWVMVPDAGRGYRRVVASPKPLATLELREITTLIESGCIVIAAGGGGVPVIRDESGSGYKGVDAVIDKDFAAERIADAANADVLALVTGVSAVRLDFGQSTERAVEDLGLSEAKRHLADGQFPAGSMGPKMAAAIRFVDGPSAGGGHRMAAITTPELVYGTLRDSSGALEGSRGTRVMADPVGSTAR